MSDTLQRDRIGRPFFQHPRDTYEFIHSRVHFKRTTGLHERGVYQVTALASSRRYTVTGGHSKRFPWRATAELGLITPSSSDYRDVGGFSTLIEAAESIAYYDATMYRTFPPARAEIPAP